MSGKPPPTSKNSLSKTQLPPFVEMLDVSQKNIIKSLWNADHLPISNIINCIDAISKEMPKEARVEYRKWRFLVDRSRMPDFYDSQNEGIKMVIVAVFEKYTDLEKFARAIMNIKPVLNNPDAFDKWMENEEIEFKEPLTQEDMKEESTSQSIATTTTDPSPSNPHIKTITSEASENPNICDAIAIDIGTSKCKIAICKEKYIQVVEHESNRSVPSYVALSEQGEWLVGRMAENYAVCLQNVIYDIRWLLGKKNSEINRVQDKKRYFFKRSEHLPDNETATFNMIGQGKDKPSEVVDAKKIFEYLLGPLFATAYKNLQDPTTIAITIPIKSEKNYKELVHDYAKSAMKCIVNAMPSSTATQNQPEDQPEIKRSKSEHDENSQQQGSENQTKLQDKSDKRTPWDSIKIELIDEPIAVAAAYAPRLNIHPKGDVALVFCMGAGYLQVAAYFIQEKAQEEKANWTDLTISQISGVEPIVVEDFAGNDIDRLVFDKMMDKVTQQNGGSRPKISTRAERRLKIACEKMKCALSFAPHTRIDVDSLYKNGDEDCDLVEVIQKDEIKRYYNEEVDKIIKKVEEVYKDLKPKFILLAGGSTRIPLISENLSEVFKDSTVCNFLNVDEVAVNGAAAIISKTVTVDTKSIDYKQVTETKEQEKEEEERRNPPPTPTPTPNAEILPPAPDKKVPTSAPDPDTRVSTSDANTKVLDQDAAQDVAKNGDRDGDSHENVDAGAAKGADGNGDTGANADEDGDANAHTAPEEEVPASDPGAVPTQEGMLTQDRVPAQNEDEVVIQDADEKVLSPASNAAVTASDPGAVPTQEGVSAQNANKVSIQDQDPDANGDENENTVGDTGADEDGDAELPASSKNRELPARDAGVLTQSADTDGKAVVTTSEATVSASYADSAPDAEVPTADVEMLTQDEDADAIVSETANMTNELIDYKQVTEIKEQEKEEEEEEERRNSPSITTPDAIVGKTVAVAEEFIDYEEVINIIDEQEKEEEILAQDVNADGDENENTVGDTGADTIVPTVGTIPAGDNQSSEKRNAMVLNSNRICLFNSFTCSVEEIAKFHNCYKSYQVATTQNKIFGISGENKSFEIYDLDTRQISRGPEPPEWRECASVTYFKDKLYYLGGWNSTKYKYTNQVDVLIDGEWQVGPVFPLPTSHPQTIICDGILYVIDGRESRKIHRLSEDEREWIEVGEIPERRYSFGVASLNGRIYITGGWNYPNVLNSCLCFDPSAPVGSRTSRIADMNYARENHSLVIANGKLYAIGGFQKYYMENFCNSIEEYDPQTNKWREVGKLEFE